MLEPLKKELDRITEMGVIIKVEEPSDWCHPIVVALKPSGNIRLCIDLTKLNKATKRELYQLDSTVETLAKLGDECKIMSKLDANSGYWQMELDEESQQKCIFITLFGRFRPTRAPFGLSSMPEIFNREMDSIIEGLEGVVKSMDDFLIYGRTLNEHDERLRKFLQRMKEKGITLNREKCQFRTDSVEFLGFSITPDGVKPFNKKLEAISEFPSPTNITELRRFLGMAQQMSRFCPKLSEKADPLRELLSTKNEFLWTSEHEKTFQNVKEVLLSPTTLALYDVKKRTKVRTDGSKLKGISVIVYQEDNNGQWKPVDCASRFLSPAERNYYPIELEMLASTWGIRRMNMYLQGLRHFELETDHKPLIPIMNSKLICDLSPRLQYLRMKLLKYNFTASHVPGKDLDGADAFSRAPTSMPTEEDYEMEKEMLLCQCNNEQFTS